MPINWILGHKPQQRHYFLFLFLVSHYATLAIDLYYEVIHDIYIY